MQRTIHDRHAPAEKWRAKARSYAQELYVQFSLATDAEPQVTQHPEFGDYFR